MEKYYLLVAYTDKYNNNLKKNYFLYHFCAKNSAVTHQCVLVFPTSLDCIKLVPPNPLLVLQTLVSYLYIEEDKALFISIGVCDLAYLCATTAKQENNPTHSGSGLLRLTMTVL